MRPYRKAGSLVPLEVALEFLNSDHFYDRLATGVYSFTRCLPKKDVFQRTQDIGEFLRNVLVSGRSEDNVDNNLALRDCYHNGWLQAELLPGDKTVYIFPTKIHQWYKAPIFFTVITTGS